MNKRPGTLSECITRVPLRIDPFFRDAQLSTATAFLYRGTNGTCLVTNWHVVSGRHPETLLCLGTNAGLPDRLRLHIPINKGTPSALRVGWDAYWLPLYEDDHHENPVWRVALHLLLHPIYNGAAMRYPFFSSP